MRRFLFILLLISSLAPALPFDTKTQNGLTVGIQPAFMPSELNGIMTYCFWANQSNTLFSTPALSKSGFEFSKTTNISNVRTSLVKMQENILNETSEVENCIIKEAKNENETSEQVCESKNITTSHVVPSYSPAASSTEVLYCYDTTLETDKRGRTLLPHSNPFNITLAGKKADPDPGCNAALGTAGASYVMTANCSVNGAGQNGFNITAANITLDCANFAITGNNTTSTYGVYSSQFNSTIKNCNIQNFSTGIYIDGDAADYANITNNTINNTYATTCSYTTGACHGIFINGPDFANITSNNILTYAYGVGLQDGATYNTLRYNNISVENDRAISMYSDSGFNTVEYSHLSSLSDSTLRVYSGTNNIIRYNYIFSTQYATYVSSDSNTIQYNNISAPQSAVYLTGSDSNNVSYNNISTNGYYSIYLTGGSTNNNISNNNATSSYKSIYLTGSNSNLIEYNNATATNYAIYLASSSNNNISHNYATASSSSAIYLTGTSSSNNISYNTASSPKSPIYLNNAPTYNTISYNNVSATTEYGINLETDSNYNNVTYNNITAPNSYGVLRIYISKYNNISYNTATAAYSAVFLSSIADYNTIAYNDITTTSYYGMLVSTGSFNNITGNNIKDSGTNPAYGALHLINANDNNFTNNIINSTATGANVAKGIHIASGKNNTFTNNTIGVKSSATTPAISIIAAASGNNTFLGNNITASVWINDTSTANYYNNSNAGNIYYFKNGSGAWTVYNITSTTAPGWADGGSALPFSNETVGTNWLNYGNDSHPWTANAGAAPPAQENYTNITSISISPSSPTTANNLSCNITVRGTASLYDVKLEWWKNGVNQTALTINYSNLANNTDTSIANLSSGNLTVGDNWSCSAWANSTTNTSSWNTSANVTIQSVSVDSCTYGGSSDWVIQLAHNCNITTNQTIGGWITYNGTGNVYYINATSNLVITATGRNWTNTGVSTEWIRTTTQFNFSAK